MPEINIFSGDKIAHIAVYTLLGILFNPWLKSKRLPFYKQFLFYATLLLLAALDEYHQNFILGRSVSVYDLMANALGLSIAFVAGRWDTK
ncbi:MAG: VanZ family protein [Candidatus Cloacimonetes bacterium]|nr:VanZ family protein [Candidatus Cloacimonadota bacterium]